MSSVVIEKKQRKTKKILEVDKEVNKEVINIQSINNSFDEILDCIVSEIKIIQSEPSNPKKGIKFLRTLNKKLKLLKKENVRVSKQKNKRVNKNKNSGFLKPVIISKEMSDFTGWGSTDLHSRVDVTKYICNYIKENLLQDPSDGRKIIPDKKLGELLKYESSNETEPLRYYSLQTYLKKHFPKK
jgi:chromatin remodeling complex protein RSC6